MSDDLREPTSRPSVGPSLVERMADTQSSAADKYRSMFVGSPSLSALIGYEVLVALPSGVPGALGFLLRKIGYGYLLREVGAGSVFGQNTRVRSPGRIKLGRNVVIDDNVVLDAKGEHDSGIDIGDNVLIGRNGIVSCTDAHIHIGDHVSTGPNCYLTAKRFIDIGSNVSIGPYTALVGAGHSIEEPEVPAILQERTAEGITVQDGVWLGARVTVLDGVRIGRNAVVGAGSVVTDDVPPDCVAVGAPAKVVKKR